MLHRANKRRYDVQFQVRDAIIVKLRPYRQSLLANSLHPKLFARFYGPFTVLVRISEVSYRRRFPLHSRIHPVFHVSQLKRVVGNHPVEETLPPSIASDGSTIYLLEDILDRKIVTEDGRVREQLLVSWRQHPPSDATWLDRDDFRGQFPELCREDKAIFPYGGIVTDGSGGTELEGVLTAWRVNSRRNRATVETSA